jgi:peptide-methionine (R)-S-oxide reductase
MEESMDYLNKKIDEAPGTMARRSFLIGAGSVAVGLAWWFRQTREPVHAFAAAADLPKTVTIVEFSDSGKRLGKKSVDRVIKTEAEWKQLLSSQAFDVARLAGTERAYTNENPNNHQKGIFRCICCDTALFNADTKFDSGTGWPSFWEPIAKENVLETKDSTLGMVRIAVSCRLCDAHLGHVFDDGPRPTGLRYCMNAVAMKFVKA